MANTYVDYTGDGSNTDFVFSFPFLEDSHVVVEVDGVDKTIAGGDFTLPTTSLVRMTTAPNNLSAVRVKRVSDFGTNLVDFVNGSVLNEADLDKAYLHNRYLNEEAAEGNDASMQIVGGGTDFNAANKKIVNLATPTVTTDATNKNYVDTQVALSATNLSGFESSSHTGDNTAVDFTLSFTPQVSTPEAFLVTIDGVVQKPTTAYTIDPATPKITFTSAPPTSAVINVVAIAQSSTSANTTTVKATGSTTLRSLADRFADVVNVLDYGADRTGQTDSASAIHAALSAASSGRSKVVYFPSGEYECSTAITVPTNVSLIGEDCRVYHYYYDTDNPRMPVLRFTNDTDGVIFAGQFFKNQIKNLGIWSGVSSGTSTGIGLRLSTEDSTLVGDTTIEGLGNIYENVEVNGFQTAVLIWGAYAWNQHFQDFQVHNCKIGFEIECLSTHHTRLDNVYINVDSGHAWNHADRRGIIMRSGGRLIVDKALIENMGYCIQVAPVANSDLSDSTNAKQVYINNLYTEAQLNGTILFTSPGIVKLHNIRVAYPFVTGGVSVVRLANTSPTEKTYVDIDDIQLVGNASPDNRRVPKLFSCAAGNGASTYNVKFTNLHSYHNDLDDLWDDNFPPNYISFKERDDANNIVELFQRSTQTTRCYAVITNDEGNVPANSLQWTSVHGNTLDVTSLPNLLTTVDPIRPKNTNRKSVRYDNTNNFNGNTYNFNDLSGIRYVNFGGNLTSFSVTIDTTHMNHGDEFLITDTPSTSGATATVTFGSQTFTCNSQEFIVVRKTVESGGSTAEAYRVVARGAV